MSANDITTGHLQVRGLKQAAANLNALPGLIKTQIGRDALRAAGRVLETEVKARTYTTFHKLTGAIQSGLHVSIGHDLKGELLFGVVGEYPDAAAGVSQVGIKRMMRAGRGSVTPLDNVAFWWRFLEFGTGPRRARSTPRVAVRNQRADRTLTPRQGKQLTRWMASPSRGGVGSRAWVRPAFSAKAPEAIDAFSAAMRDGIEREVNNLPK